MSCGMRKRSMLLSVHFIWGACHGKVANTLMFDLKAAAAGTFQYGEAKEAR